MFCQRIFVYCTVLFFCEFAGGSSINGVLTRDDTYIHIVLVPFSANGVSDFPRICALYSAYSTYNQFCSAPLHCRQERWSHESPIETKSVWNYGHGCSWTWSPAFLTVILNPPYRFLSVSAVQLLEITCSSISLTESFTSIFTCSRPPYELTFVQGLCLGSVAQSFRPFGLHVYSTLNF